MSDIADEIIDKFEAQIAAFSNFELIVGSSSLGGAGDKWVIKINVEYDELDEQQVADIDAILAIANKRASSLEVLKNDCE